MNINHIRVIWILAAMLSVGALPTTVSAYSVEKQEKKSVACKDVGPQFVEMSPKRDATVDSFSEFKFILERKADVRTLVVKIDGKPVETQTKEHANARMSIWGTLNSPIVEKGTVLVSALIQNGNRACTARLVYRVNISGASATAEPTLPAEPTPPVEENSDTDATAEDGAE